MSKLGEIRQLWIEFQHDTAFRRFGRPVEIADVVEFLVSRSGGWVTGQVIEASGGYRLFKRVMCTIGNRSAAVIIYRPASLSLSAMRASSGVEDACILRIT